jgi:hypothetical protein
MSNLICDILFWALVFINIKQALEKTLKILDLKQTLQVLDSKKSRSINFKYHEHCLFMIFFYLKLTSHIEIFLNVSNYWQFGICL